MRQPDTDVLMFHFTFHRSTKSSKPDMSRGRFQQDHYEDRIGEMPLLCIYFLSACERCRCSKEDDAGRAAKLTSAFKGNSCLSLPSLVMGSANN